MFSRIRDRCDSHNNPFLVKKVLFVNEHSEKFVDIDLINVRIHMSCTICHCSIVLKSENLALDLREISQYTIVTRQV